MQEENSHRCLEKNSKKYWESKGYNVSVKKRKSWLLGDRIVYERGKLKISMSDGELKVVKE